MSKQIIFIRHGEKTADDPVHLSNVGVLRSKEIVSFFVQKINPNIDIPDMIIAMKQHTSHSSDRPRETVIPLANSLGINVLTPYTRDEIDDLVDFIFKHKDQKNILICWEHSVIADIMKLLLTRIYKHMKHMHLNWNSNPESSSDDGEDYSSIWVIDGDYFHVYKQFDHEKKPLFSLNLA